MYEIKNQSLFERVVESYASVVTAFVVTIFSIPILLWVITGYVFSLLPFIAALGIFFGIPVVGIWGLVCLFESIAC